MQLSCYWSCISNTSLPYCSTRSENRILSACLVFWDSGTMPTLQCAFHLVVTFFAGPPLEAFHRFEQQEYTAVGSSQRGRLQLIISCSTLLNFDCQCRSQSPSEEWLSNSE
mmetsp:Transcript_21848/g.43349  ORF Transcript_21848/g.43349 Transcript_21848/m.43349 type:complete len:111 (-) Transcript_21848:781-1113(-)